MACEQMKKAYFSKQTAKMKLDAPTWGNNSVFGNIWLLEFKLKTIYSSCGKQLIGKSLWNTRSLRILSYTGRAETSACPKFDVSGKFSGLNADIVSGAEQYSQILSPIPFYW